MCPIKKMKPSCYIGSVVLIGIGVIISRIFM